MARRMTRGTDVHGAAVVARLTGEAGARLDAVLDDGTYDALVVDAGEAEGGGVSIELTIVAGPAKGEVVTLLGHGLRATPRPARRAGDADRRRRRLLPPRAVSDRPPAGAEVVAGVDGCRMGGGHPRSAGLGLAVAPESAR